MSCVCFCISRLRTQEYLKIYGSDETAFPIGGDILDPVGMSKNLLNSKLNRPCSSTFVNDVVPNYLTAFSPRRLIPAVRQIQTNPLSSCSCLKHFVVKGNNFHPFASSGMLIGGAVSATWSWAFDSFSSKANSRAKLTSLPNDACVNRQRF